MDSKEIIISDFDKERLSKLIQLYKSKNKMDQNIMKLENELTRAKIISQYSIPNNIITINSKVKYRIIPASLPLHPFKPGRAGRGRVSPLENAGLFHIGAT